jgi:Flp pilus assembly protein TadD
MKPEDLKRRGKLVFCANCGQELALTHAFCLKCGEPQDVARPGTDEEGDLAEQHENEGDKYFELGHLPQALAEYEEAAMLDSNNPTYMAKKAAVLSAMGRSDEAVEACNEAVTLDPTNPDLRSQKCNLLLIIEEYDRALDEINQAISLDPTNANHHAMKCHALCLQDSGEEALEEIKIAMRMEPDDSALLLNEAIALATCGEPQDAENSLYELLRLTDLQSARRTIDLALGGLLLREPQSDVLSAFVGNLDRIQAGVSKELPYRMRTEFRDFIFELVYGPMAGVDTEDRTVARARTDMLSVIPSSIRSQIPNQDLTQLFENQMVSPTELTEQEDALLWGIAGAWYVKYAWLEDTLLNLDKFKTSITGRGAGSLHSEVRKVLIEAIAKDMPRMEFKLRISSLLELNNVTKDDLGIGPASGRVSHLIELYHPIEKDPETQLLAKSELYGIALKIELALVDLCVGLGYGMHELHRFALEKAPKYAWLEDELGELSIDPEGNRNVNVCIFLGLSLDLSRGELEKEIEDEKLKASEKKEPEG